MVVLQVKFSFNLRRVSLTLFFCYNLLICLLVIFKLMTFNFYSIFIFFFMIFIFVIFLSLFLYFLYMCKSINLKTRKIVIIFLAFIHLFCSTCNYLIVDYMCLWIRLLSFNSYSILFVKFCM